MKKTSIAIAIALSIFTEVLHAQSRDAGQLVAPIGWENSDSIRWGAFGASEFMAEWDTLLPGRAVMDSLLDLHHFNYQGEWGDMHYDVPFGGRRRAIDAHSAPPGTWGFGADMTDFGERIRQRMYYSLPDRQSLSVDAGYFWRYNDQRFNPNATVHQNPYDSNDISPYVIYPQNPDFVRETFLTRRFNVGSDDLALNS